MPQEAVSTPIPTPPPPAPDVTPLITPPARPKQNKKLLVIPLVVAGVLLILMILVSIIKSVTTPRRNVAVLPSPTATVVNPNVTPSVTPIKIPITPLPPRLPLTALSGHQLITASDNKLWLVNFTSVGPQKSLLLDVDYKIIDLSVSPNSNLVAFTFANSNSPTGEGIYPKTGLKIMDLKTSAVTEFISLGETVVRRPTWSSDSLYLAVWNNGKSVVLYDMTNKSRPLRIDSSSISQIVFIPGLAKFSYVDNNSLYEADYTGAVKNKVLDGVNTLRGLSSAEILPDTHHYSYGGRFIVYHNLIGQLILYDRNDSTQQILAEGMESRTRTGYYSFGDILGIDSTSTSLVYFNLGKEVYIAGPDDNPLFIYNLTTKTGTPFFSNRKETIKLGAHYPDAKNEKILLADNGYRVFNFFGKMLSSCENTQLTNDPTYAPGRLWTKDSKYFLSEKTYQVTDTTTCEITAQVDPSIPETSAWIK